MHLIEREEKLSGIKKRSTGQGRMEKMIWKIIVNKKYDIKEHGIGRRQTENNRYTISDQMHSSD